jgi:phospholipase C
MAAQHKAKGEGNLRTGKKYFAALAALLAAGAAAIGISMSSASNPPAPQIAALTPIQHVVVIFPENISFDHYFGTYPYASNAPGEPAFHALPGTPGVNGLSNGLLTNNPNLDNPKRLGRAEALTCDQNHSYTPEQEADDGGLMNEFVQKTTGSSCSESGAINSSKYGPKGIVMDYYDGNTVTGLWNYAQHYALNDNSYDNQFGPSSPGAINLISGDSEGAEAHGGSTSSVVNGVLQGDAEPYFDQCSNASSALSAEGLPGGVTVSMTGKNVGNLMNEKGVTWGWFQGGFAPSATENAAKEKRAVCNTSHKNIGNATVTDYVQHHEPFEFYESTANPDHVAPSSLEQVGYSDPAGTKLSEAVNHQYDLSWFNRAVTEGNMPQVSFLKPPAYENGHAGNSDPLDEQRFLVEEINTIEESKYWANTAIIIDYDDSDGWYDHQLGPVVYPSNDTSDQLNGAGKCGTVTAEDPEHKDRCGVGPRLPLMVISPWARSNYVDGTFTVQSSVTRFIEENWGLAKIGGTSEDATSGTLDNMFDFSRSDNRAPAIILNSETGEIEHEIPSPENEIREGKEGKEGKEGPAGAEGKEGTAGKEGTPGKEGSAGPAGSEGPAGKEGPAGPQGKEGKAGPAGPQGAEGQLGKITCTHTGKHYAGLEIQCVASASTASVHKDRRAIVTLVRDHRVVARGVGIFGSKIALKYRGHLSGRYTMFVEIPGVTTFSRVVRLG